MNEITTTGISVLLVDDHPIVRQGYRRVLEIQARLLGRVVSGELSEYPGFETR